MSFKSDRYLGNPGVSAEVDIPLSSSLTSNSEATAATSKVVKNLNDKIVDVAEQLAEIMNEGIVENSITPKEVSFLNVVYSENLYNPSIQTIDAVRKNALFNVSGVITEGTSSPYTSYFITAPIYLKSGQYACSHLDLYGALAENRRAWIYDKNDNPIVAVNDLNAITFPLDGHYLRICIMLEGWTVEQQLANLSNQLMIVEGDVIPSTFIPYKETIEFDDSIEVKATHALTADRLTTPISVSKPLFVSFQNEELRVISKYSATQDILFIFGKKGVNNIFDFKEIKFINNTTGNVSENTTDGTVYFTFNSDNFSPHQITAKNNGDGDNPTGYDFTGGNHGYNNTGILVDNSATGRTSSVSLKVEGRKVDEYSGTANFIEISWSNMIQGSNTKKVDGSGREILKESYKMTFNGINWDIDYMSEALEDIFYGIYYGLQLQTSMWRGGIFYHTSPKKTWNDNNEVESNSEDATTKRCNRISLKSHVNNHFVDIEIDTAFGIGNREFVQSNLPNAFQTTYHKCYWNLIRDVDISANTVLTYKGGFKFYSV